MALTDAQREEAGRLLHRAEHPTAPVEPLSASLPGLDLADAYAIQRDNVARRIADGAVSGGEWDDGLTTVAVPVTSRSGEVIASLSLSGPSHRFPYDDVYSSIVNQRARAEVRPWR